MNRKTILAAAASVIAMLTTAGTALALAPSDQASDQNLRYSRAYLDRTYDALSHDQADYGGHRVAAMNDINDARNDLTAALKYDNNPQASVVPSDVRSEDADIAAFVRGQAASNRNLDNEKLVVERVIDMLQRDAADYGGYRAKAIAALQAAHDQLADAIAYRNAHPNSGGSMDRDDNHGMNASDDNIRYTRLYVNRAVDMLQRDQRDYSGHRAAAVTDLQRAQADLMNALRSDTNKEDATLPTRAMTGDEDLDSYYTRGQFASNQNIAYVRRYVERAIDMLQKDQHDYNGYRVKAIQDLQAARQELLSALQSQ